MTHAAPRRRGGKTWALPAAAIAIVGLAMAIGWVSRSIALDAASWWVVWLALAAVGFWSRGMTIGAWRVPGLIAVSSVVIIVVFVVGHLQGWSLMPSSAGRLSGSPDGAVSTAALSARLPEGRLSVEAGESGSLYVVEPLRLGGRVAPAVATERSQQGNVSIEFAQQDDPGLLRWRGWDLRLSNLPVWTLTLEGQIDADLTDLSLENLQMIGAGAVYLGPVNRSTPVTVSGDFVITVPPDTPVRVIGPAQIPDGWERTDSGASSPAQGQGWVISIGEGSVVEVRAD